VVTERTANCPSCGGPLRFRGATSIVAVCAFCKSTLVREGADLENIGKQAELLPDDSPIRIGADGKHKGNGFTVVGRIQYRYGAGIWNEWHVVFSDGKSAWLSDASREYTIVYLSRPEQVPLFEHLKPGLVLELAKVPYTVMNLEQAEVVAGEGELPFRFESGWKADVADLRGEGARFATIDYSEDPPHIYVGEKLPFDQFGFAGLRDASQIGFTKGRALAFKCGGCGAPVESHIAASEVVACASCGSITDVTKGVGEVVQRAEKHKKKFKPSIPLGAEGTWKNVKYEVVGLMRRQIAVDGEKYEWTEYLLHNAERGYAWVSEYNGHFSIIHNASEVPKPARTLGKPRMSYLGHNFEHFQKSEPRVVYLAGEFYWQVRLGDRAVCNDYVAPPLILSSEATGNELTWSFGEYVEGPELWKAFKLKDKPPRPAGVAPNQPSPHTGTPLLFWKAFLAFVVVAAVMQPLLSWMNSSSTPAPVPFKVALGQRAQATSEPFKLGGILEGPVTLRTSSNVRDTWVSLDLLLTNADTGTAYGVKRQVGFTRIGTVADGSSEDVAELPSVPPGRYTLSVDARSGPLAFDDGRVFTGTVEAYRSRLGWSNFWLFALAISIWPFIAWRRARAFEARRWSESDYADEYSSGGDDDE
jgi:hypothetical protein